jgi:hypothetical protein
MDGPSLIFIVMLTVMPLLLSTGIAMPYIADSLSRRKDRDMRTTFAARQNGRP